MISSAFPSTPTGALVMLLNIMPINEFIMSEAVKSSYRISRMKFWPAKTIGSTRKNKSHVGVCNEAKENLPLLSMPADLITKTKVLRCLFFRYGKKTVTEKIYSPILFLTFRLALNAKLHQKMQ